jgi:hypothetical protein
MVKLKAGKRSSTEIILMRKKTAKKKTLKHAKEVFFSDSKSLLFQVEKRRCLFFHIRHFLRRKKPHSMMVGNLFWKLSSLENERKIKKIHRSNVMTNKNDGHFCLFLKRSSLIFFCKATIIRVLTRLALSYSYSQPIPIFLSTSLPACKQNL